MSVKVHEPVCEDSAQDLYFWFDHFLGDQIKDEWRTAGGGTGTVAVVDAQTGGVCRLNTPVAGDTGVIDWANFRTLHVTKKVTLETRLKCSANTIDRYIEIYLYFDASNYVVYRIQPAGTNDLYRCTNGGASTSFSDDGFINDTNYHIIRIECHTHGANHVHFYLDGVERASSPITTNIPDDAGDYLQPYFIGLNINPGTGGAIYYDVDYVAARQER